MASAMPDLRLPSQPYGGINALGPVYANLYCLPTKAKVCEHLAAAVRPGDEPATFKTQLVQLASIGFN